MIDVDERQVIQLLQKEVGRIVVDVTARVAPDGVQEHLERDTVENVFAGMNLEADIDPVLLIEVQDRLPPASKLTEGLLDETCGALRPGIEVGECKRARKGDHYIEPKIA